MLRAVLQHTVQFWSPTPRAAACSALNTVKLGCDVVFPIKVGAVVTNACVLASAGACSCPNLNVMVTTWRLQKQYVSYVCHLCITFSSDFLWHFAVLPVPVFM